MEQYVVERENHYIMEGVQSSLYQSLTVIHDFLGQGCDVYHLR